MALVDVNDLMAQSKGFYHLPLIKQLGLMVGLAASVAIGVATVFWSQSPDYRLLYSNLTEQDANQMTQALQQSGIKFRLTDGASAVMVPAGDVSSARMLLAGEGLPKGGDSGFELLDKSEGFGVSQFMENTRYQRALEGELARTVKSLDSVRNARVHLALPKQSAFIRKRKLPTGSVTVDLLPGRFLGEPQVAAIRHMVAASVPGLDPDSVMVIDQHGRLLTSPVHSRDFQVSSQQFDYRKRMEDYYEKRIEEILSPLVGANAVRAQVAAELDFTVTEKSREAYDPKNSVLRSEHVEEQQSTDNISAGGVPGSLTNQPPQGGVVGAPGGAARTPAGEPVQRSKTMTKNYELDKTISHVRTGGGVVDRLSIAVVVDFRAAKDDKGKVVRDPYSAEELGRMEALVKRAVGFDTKRGDQVEVVNAPFTDTMEVQMTEVAGPAFYERPELVSWIKQGVGALLILYLLMGVLKPVLRSLAAASKEREKEKPVSGEVLPEDQLSLTGPEGAVMKAQGQRAGEPALPEPTFDDRLNSAREIVSQDPKRAAQVVNNWLAAE